MHFEFNSVVLSLTVLQHVMSDIGEFAPYGDDANDSTFSKATENFLPQESGRHRSIIWNLPKSFPAFGKERTRIRVSS